MKLVHYFPILILVAVTFACRNVPGNQRDHVAWADSISERSFNIMDGPVPELSLQFIDSAYRAKNELGIADIWRKYNAKAHYYAYYKTDLVLRRMYVDSMFILLDGVHEKYKTEYARSMYFLASLLHAEKKYNQAFKVYYDGWTFAKEHLDRCTMAEYSNALGNIRYQQEQYKEAIPYIKQAFEEIESCPQAEFQFRFVLPQSILNTIGLCFEKSGRGDSAVIYYIKALELIEKRGKEFPERSGFVEVATAVLEGNLGGAYMRLDHFAEAEAHLKKNISINDRPGYAIEDAQTAKTKLIRLYITHGKMTEADALLGQLERDLKTGRGKSKMNTEVWSAWYELKWMYYDKINNQAGAYQFLKRYNAFTDSLAKINSGLKHADMDQVLKEHEQQFELSLLQKNSELKSVYLLAALVILVLTILVAAVISYYLKKSRKSVRELTRMNYRKQLALAALENSQKENTRIMKIVAHDLRGPIGAITAMADLMLQEEGRSADDIEALELIKNGGDNSLQLVNSLLQVNGPMVEDIKDVISLEDLVHYCADMLEHQAQKKGQRIDVQVEPVLVKVNYEKMWRVLSNLLSNAIKFSPPGSVIGLKGELAGDKILIMVKDEGIGIPQELGDKIFDIFTDAKRRGTSGEESFGLGLSISKQIVEAHKGKIWFEANTPQGTIFKIQLPAETI